MNNSISYEEYKTTFESIVQRKSTSKKVLLNSFFENENELNKRLLIKQSINIFDNIYSNENVRIFVELSLRRNPTR